MLLLGHAPQHPYTLVYRLDPVRAFELRLVNTFLSSPARKLMALETSRL